MKNILIVLALVFTLGACGEFVAEEPAPTPEPPVIVIPTPDPVPDPVIEYAPVGTCPIKVTLDEQRRTFDDGTGATRGPAIIAVTLGSPCEDGDLVPFVYREDLLWDDTFLAVIDGVLVAGGSVHGVNAVNFAIPFADRARRFEIVDVRTGEVVASVQNYRLRTPRPF